MKLLKLTKKETRTLRDMGIYHRHPGTGMRTQAIIRLSQVVTLQQTAQVFEVHINCVER